MVTRSPDTIFSPAADNSRSHSHPGRFVRDTVIKPKKLSVVAAAKLVGVGRPALSNFLNGHVAATPSMASRIEVAFGIPSKTLLDMQARFDSALYKEKGTPVNAIRYVVPFLQIKANDIEAWVHGNIAARSRLAVFLRTLVNSTGISISKSNFAGNDDAERPGWDGYVDSAESTPWIPRGLSGWEFGTNQNIKQKADGDFAKAVNATPKVERDQTTFVFVTPRRWIGRDEWIKANQARGLWKEVRAYDASTLEQWLEQSIPSQAWFSNETHRPSSGVRSLDRCWAEWANVADPPLASSFFATAIHAAKQMIAARLSNPPIAPIAIAADSAEEALAFIAQLFGPEGGADLKPFRDRIVVFDDVGFLPKLAQGGQDFIAVTANRDVERELGQYVRSMHCIVVYPRNAANVEPDIILEPLNYDAFSKSVEEMGYQTDDVTRLNNESGRSLTLLRRRLATVPAIRTPGWAADSTVATSLIPFLFIGAWNSTNAADQTVLVLLVGNASYDEIEKRCQLLTAMSDPPLWSVGTYRGTVSKIDLLFAIAGTVTAYDLRRYYDVAKIVLSEDDPKLDLPDGDRWAAAVYGKSREFSRVVRDGISETLVLLAVYGNQLFKGRLGFDCEVAAADLVKELLTPLNTRVLEANDNDLSTYAEAAPDTFLSILEEDLKTEQPQCYGLMRPVPGVFGASCARTGLLWALEGLAWNANTLSRVALVLAQLAEIEIHDNWLNRPINSLISVFRAWMPQTKANHDARVRVAKLITERFPKIGWRVCIEQARPGPETGHYNHKPKWRNDGHGAGQPFRDREPILAFRDVVIDIVLNWKGGYTAGMVCDLIQNFHGWSQEHQTKMWALVKSWSVGKVSDADRAEVREKIRVTVMSRRGRKQFAAANFASLSAAANATYQALEPTDLLSKHAWLFRQHHVEESADELHDDGLGYAKRQERISKLRTGALREVYETKGFAGIFELAERGQTGAQIGWLMTRELLPDAAISGFLLNAASPSPSKLSVAKKELISGSLASIGDEKKRNSLLEAIRKGLSATDFVQLLLLAPFRRAIWHVVEKLPEPHREAYWSDARPGWILDADDEIIEAVQCLLMAQRPRAAFSCAHNKLETVGPELLFRLMTAMAKGGKDQPGDYPLDAYHIAEAFAIIDKSTALSLEQKAGLEFAYIDVLSASGGARSEHGIPNLEKYIETHPELYVQAVVWAYRRNDDAEDPPEWKVAPDQVQNLAERGYKLLEGLERLPGRDDLGELQANQLAAWVKNVRDACTKLSRLDVADIKLGKLLSCAPAGEDGIWPCVPVRIVLEDFQSQKMIQGARTGQYNSRGVTTRGDGGTQERVLAEKYRRWANELQYSHPFVASQLLMELANIYEQEAHREDTEAGIRRRLS